MNYRIYLNGILCAAFTCKTADCGFEPAEGIVVRGIRTAGDVTEVNLDVPERVVNAATRTFTGLTQEEIALVQQGKKIQAIKQVRDRLHLGLKDAKDKVDLAEKSWVESAVMPPNVGTGTP